MEDFCTLTSVSLRMGSPSRSPRSSCYGSHSRGKHGKILGDHKGFKRVRKTWEPTNRKWNLDSNIQSPSQTFLHHLFSGSNIPSLLYNILDGILTSTYLRGSNLRPTLNNLLNGIFIHRTYMTYIDKWKYAILPHSWGGQASGLQWTYLTQNGRCTITKLRMRM